LRERGRQFAQSARDSVRLEIEPVQRRAGAVDPPDPEAERFRTERVPAVGGDEADVAGGDAEPFCRERSTLRRRL
jgi:hypothetical protein